MSVAEEMPEVVQEEASTDSLLHAALGLRGRIKAFHGMEHYRVMRDDHIAPLTHSLRNDLLGNIDGEQSAVYIIIHTAYDKARIIIRLLQAKRSKRLYRCSNISYFHRLKQ